MDDDARLARLRAGWTASTPAGPVENQTGWQRAKPDVLYLLDLVDQLRADHARLQQAVVGACASCGRTNRVVYFDREALVCADYDDCWAACVAAWANQG